MSDYMHINFNFKDWNTYDDYTKSFIIYFMKHAKLEIFNDSSISVQLNVIDERATTGADHIDVHIICSKNGVPSLSCESGMFIHSTKCINSSNTERNASFSNDVSIKSFVGNKEISDSSYVFHNLPTSVGIDNSNLNYSYALRTPNFCLIDNENTERNLFYKVGIYKFPKSTDYYLNDSGPDVDYGSVVDYVKNSILIISEHFYFQTDISNYISLYMNSYEIDHQGLLHSFLFPIVDRSVDCECIYGLMYFDLYNSDGTSVDDDLVYHSLKGISSTNEYIPVSSIGGIPSLQINLTEDHIDDNSFIPSV